MLHKVQGLGLRVSSLGVQALYRFYARISASLVFTKAVAIKQTGERASADSGFFVNRGEKNQFPSLKTRKKKQWLAMEIRLNEGT